VACEETQNVWFASSIEHVLAELDRIHYLIRARAADLNEHRSDDSLQGLCISASELETLLARTPSEDGAASHRPGDGKELEALSENIARRAEAALGHGVPLRLTRLARLFGLTRFDIDILLIALAPEIDQRYERVYAYLQDDVTRKHASISLLLDLLCETLRQKLTARSHFSPSAPLVYHRLIIFVDEPAQSAIPLLRRSVKLDDRVVEHLLGSSEIDARVSRCSTLIEPRAELDELFLPAETKARFSRLVEAEKSGASNLVVLFHGPAGVGKRTTAEALCKRLGIGLLHVNLGRFLKHQEPEFALTLNLLIREAALTGSALYLDDFTAILADDYVAHLQSVLKTVERHRGITFLGSDALWQPQDSLADKTVISVEFSWPETDERLALWTRAKVGSSVSDEDLHAAARRFRLTAGQIRDAANSARNQAFWRDPHSQAITLPDLQGACRLHSNRKLASLAQKITARQCWQDIVLPSDRMQQLREIYNAAKYGPRVFEEWGFGKKLSLGKGISALFRGPSGTGKTMAAEIIAGELGQDLYKIDLSSVVSKYIGETEKNLSRIFSEAESANAILFFDEADALFGKRSEVRDAHDRYANIETGYLLQRMEAYEGVAILATNLGKNMDEAFTRRLHFIVDFPFPDERDRREIWNRIFPAETPCSRNVDYDLMARRFEFAGGNIKNVALAAAFMAAANGGEVSIDHLLNASRREYQKMGKVIIDGDFDA
jgi:SpoVK/Ycf46/Vps4 family AAA+-type ATPase